MLTQRPDLVEVPASVAVLARVRATRKDIVLNKPSMSAIGRRKAARKAVYRASPFFTVEARLRAPHRNQIAIGARSADIRRAGDVYG
jgi:hypothetical protein